jgi:hypothetical protein
MVGSGHAVPVMERTAGKTFFTRRRLLTVGVPLLIALAVIVAVWRPQNVSVHDLKVEFVRFETSDDDGSEDYAVLNVRNESSRRWVLLGAHEWVSLKNEKGIFQALGRFVIGPPTGESGRVARSYIGGGVVHSLKTNALDKVAVPLPRMGETGWIEIFCWTPPEVRHGLFGLGQQLWWRCVRGPTSFWIWVRCEVPIQCGRDRAYGKLVPPRVLSQDGKTPASRP